MLSINVARITRYLSVKRFNFRIFVPVFNCYVLAIFPTRRFVVVEASVVSGSDFDDGPEEIGRSFNASGICVKCGQPEKDGKCGDGSEGKSTEATRVEVEISTA